MASVNAGTAILKFGTTTVAGYVIETVSENTTSESIQIQDEDGQYIADIHSFGEMTDVTISVIPLESTTAPSIGDTFTYTSETFGSKKITVKSIDVSSNHKDITRWTINGQRFPGITLT